jgi:two-component system NarL family sensor kinase
VNITRDHASFSPTWLPSTWLILAGALFAISFGAIFVGRHLALPSDGARLEPGGNAITSDGVILTPLHPDSSPLQVGDLVVAVDGVALETWARNLFSPNKGAPRRAAGDTLRYTVIRQGKSFDLPIQLGAYPFGAIVRKNWGTIAFALASQIVATFVFIRRPNLPAGRILFLSAACLTSSTAWSFGLQVSDFMDGVGFWLFEIATLIFYDLYWTLNFHFTLTFPRPLPLLRKRRWLLPAIYVFPFFLLGIYLVITMSTSSGILNSFRRWPLAEGAHAAVFLSLTLAALVWQYRLNVSGETRRQVRWVLFAGLLSGGAGLLLYILPGALGLGAVGPNIVGLIVLPFPIAIAIAILRNNLFDIDTLINRTMVYGALTLGTMAIYVFIVGFLGEFFQARQRSLISFLATGLVAILFQPLRERLQRSVNRLMYGERDNPYAVLSKLGRRLEESVNPETTLPTVVETIAQALKLPYVAIELKDTSHYTLAASYGLEPTGKIRLRTLPLVYQQEQVGRMILSPRDSGESFTPAEGRLLEDIARHVGIAANAVQLTDRLQKSRLRLVTAREEERLRIRRELHDGLGPQLANLTLRVDVARNLLKQDPGAVDEFLVKLKEQTKSALGDIRRIAYNLRPPALDQLGFLPAVREQVTSMSGASGITIRLDAPKEIPPLPAAVEVAAYRIIQEALTNAIHHSGAKHCNLGLVLQNELQLEICDDGCGLPEDLKSGIGLNSMRERAEELGGACTISNHPDGGTRVWAKLPLTYSDESPISGEEA